MKISSDVNAIFAYDDALHKFHKKVCLFMATKKRTNYILLSNVKAHFIHTYKDYLSTCCVVIDQSIREHREERAKSPSKTYKPSLFAISTNIRQLIDKKLNEYNSKMNFNLKATKRFIDLLLTKYSLPELYKNDEALANFREKYSIQSEERSAEVLNKFLRFFNNFEAPSMGIYANYNKWLDAIKKSSLNIFKNKRDMEDMEIAAEFMSYNEEFDPLMFFGFDVDCCNSIIKFAKSQKQKIGHVHLITA